VVYGQGVGCSGGSGAGPQNEASPNQTGTVGLSLTLLGGGLLDSVNYTITGPNGTSTVVSQGSVNLQNSMALSFTVGGIPAGSNYSVALSGVAVGGAVTCSGSATFSVTARTTTNVTVLLNCGSPAPDAGAVSVGAQPYLCATATSVSASPSETTLGNSVALSASAVAPSAANLAYSWSAPSGTFSATNSPSTNFTCTTQGSVTVTATVSDGTVPDGGTCSAALASMSVQVQCDTASDGGSSADATVDSGSASACSLGAGGVIQHVIYIQFDNTHLYRDADRAGNTNVPSDLEQMPHLLNFIRGNGTMMANDHTQLISHTAGGMLTSLTGVYPDRHGQTVTNSYVRTSSTGAFSFPSSFAYWTDPAASNTTIPNMVQPDGTNMPAPWASYTRAGCNFGAVASANMVLENTGTGSSGDITTVFGIGSPQYLEAVESNGASTGTAENAIAVTDFEGLAVHCAQGSSVCAGGEADLLPQEPGGYTGFHALFGAKQIDPVLTGASDASVAVTDMLGNPIADPFGQPGFPGFNGMTAAVALGYMAAMQEHGVPVTFAYISDAHDNHGTDGNGQTAYGPGAAGYVAQLQAYDAAFANFFTRLANDGINQTNTLFIFTVDEGDHFVGGAPTPTTCDGVTTPCVWASDQIGEIDMNIDTLMSEEQPAIASKFLGSGAPDSFTVHGDDAPTFYLSRVSSAAGPVGALSQTDHDTRSFEQAAAALTFVSPYTGNTDSLLYQMADQTGMQAVHMYTTGDPARNPVFAYFGNDDYFITDFPSSTCVGCLDPSYAWNHGDDQSIIGMTWLGFVGPGVVSQNNGPDQTIFTDHTDVRPTIMSILGLEDDYSSDGRVITEALQPSAYSTNLDANLATTQSLGQSYKQINAPFGPFARCALSISTVALQANNAAYTSLESQLASLISTRNTLASSIIGALNAAEFGGTPVSTAQANSWISEAATLLANCQALQANDLDAGGGEAGVNESGASDAGPGDSGAGDTGASDAGSSEAGTSDAGAAVAAVAVYRVGNGSAALSGAATPVFLDEFSATGALVTSIAMPTTSGSGSVANALVASGSATSEGELTLATNGHYILMTGYNAAVGTASIASTTSASTARVVGRVDADGDIDTTTALNAFSANNPRSVASPDGMNLWLGGANTGAIFTTLGSATFTTLNTSTTNLRQLGIFDSQLYASSASGSLRLGAVGSGLPMSADGATLTINELPGFDVVDGGITGDPYGFFFTTLNGGSGPDTLYVADDTIGITKWTLSSGTWTSTGTVGSSADAYRGLTGIVNGTTVTLFATGTGGSGKLVAVVDATGYGGTFSATPTTLVTPATNTAFRGVALAPQ
jgi:hypothetical protein